MSAVQDLSQQLNSLADATREHAEQLSALSQQLQDQASALSQQLESSQTGTQVAQNFSAAVSSVGDASGQLQTAAQSARDYAQQLLSN